MHHSLEENLTVDAHTPGLQITRSNKDNSERIFLVSQRKIHCDPHKNRHGETVIMKGRNICFCGQILKINYPCNPFLTVAAHSCISVHTFYNS